MSSCKWASYRIPLLKAPASSKSGARSLNGTELSRRRPLRRAFSNQTGQMRWRATLWSQGPLPNSSRNEYLWLKSSAWTNLGLFEQCSAFNFEAQLKKIQPRSACLPDLKFAHWWGTTLRRLYDTSYWSGTWLSAIHHSRKSLSTRQSLHFHLLARRLH